MKNLVSKRKLWKTKIGKTNRNESGNTAETQKLETVRKDRGNSGNEIGKTRKSPETSRTQVGNSPETSRNKSDKCRNKPEQSRKQVGQSPEQSRKTTERSRNKSETSLKKTGT